VDSSLTHRFADVNGVRLHIAEQGQGPLILLLHGWPESWYSWRHQFGPLAAAGYRVVAPDQRGYARSEQPPDVMSYTLLHLVGDMIALIEELGEEQAVVVGHDWGAPVAWTAAMLRPDKVRAVAGLSIPPILPGGMVPPSITRTQYGEGFYQIYFQQPGVADAELAKDIPDPSAASWSVPQATTRSAGSPARWSYPTVWASWTPCRSRPLSRPG
jgi:pimeloyl-ACP methyl ester carboxylesterase